MKTLKIFEFSDIFHFADKNYGISWNECNTVFFGNSLDYQKHTTVYPSDWGGYVSFYKEARDKASDYTKEEVDAMNDLDKSHVILGAYFESLDIVDSEVLVDCT